MRGWGAYNLGESCPSDRAPTRFPGKGEGPHGTPPSPHIVLLHSCEAPRAAGAQGTQQASGEDFQARETERGPGRGVASLFLECTLTRSCRQDCCPASGKQQSCEHPSGTGVRASPLSQVPGAGSWPLIGHSGGDAETASPRLWAWMRGRR